MQDENKLLSELLSGKSGNLEAFIKAKADAMRKAPPAPADVRDPGIAIEEARIKQQRAEIEQAYRNQPNRAAESIFNEVTPSRMATQSELGELIPEAPKTRMANPSEMYDLDMAKYKQAVETQPETISLPEESQIPRQKVPTSSQTSTQAFGRTNPNMSSPKAASMNRMMEGVHSMGIPKSQIGAGILGVAGLAAHRHFTKDDNEPFFAAEPGNPFGLDEMLNKGNTDKPEIKAENIEATLGDVKARKIANALSPELADKAYKIFPNLDQVVTQPLGPLEGRNSVPNEENTDSMNAGIPPHEQDTIAPSQISSKQESIPQTEPAKQALAQLPQAQQPSEDTALLEAQKLRNNLQGSNEITKLFSQLVSSQAKTKENTGVYDNAIKNAGQGIENLKEQRSQEEVLTKLATDKAKADPNSDVSRLARDSLREITQGMNINIPEGMSAKQIETLYPYISQAASAKEARELKRLMASQAVDAKKSAASSKLDPHFQKFTEKLNEDMVPSRSALGKEVMRRNQATHALALLENYKDLNKVPAMQKRELAVALATMISPGLPHADTIAELDPATIDQRVKESVTSLTGKPYGAGAGGIIEMLKDSVIRQQEVANDRIGRYHKTIEHSYNHLKKADPQRFEDSKRAVLGDLEDVAPAISKDPQIEKFAKDNRLSYDQANQIIENRKKGRK